MNIEKEQADFEKWHLSLHGSSPKDLEKATPDIEYLKEGDYLSLQLRVSFEAWQARAAKVPWLPSGWSACRIDNDQIAILREGGDIGTLVIAKSFVSGSSAGIAQQYLYDLLDAILSKQEGVR